MTEDTRTEATPFEDALDITGNGVYNVLLVVVCAWILLAIGVDLFGFSLVVASACDLELTVTQKGILSSLPFVGILLVSYFWGCVSDMRGRRFSLVLSLLVAFVLSCLTSISPNWLFLGLVKFFSVCFSCAANSATYTLVGESCVRRVRNKYMLLMTCLILLAPAVAAVFTYPTLQLDFAAELSWLGVVFRPWRLLIVVLAVPSGIGGIAIYFFYESPKFLANCGRKEEALDVLKSIYAFNQRCPRDNFKVKFIIPPELSDHEIANELEKEIEESIDRTSAGELEHEVMISDLNSDSEQSKNEQWFSEDEVPLQNICQASQSHTRSDNVYFNGKYNTKRKKQPPSSRVSRNANVVIERTGLEGPFNHIKALDLGEETSKKEMSPLRSMFSQAAPLFEPALRWRTIQLFYIVAVVYITNNSFLVWLPQIFNLVMLSMESGHDEGNICSLIARRTIVSNFTESSNSTAASNVVEISPDSCLGVIEDNVILTLIASQSAFSFLNFIISYFPNHRRTVLLTILSLSSASGVCCNLMPEPIASVFFFVVFTCTCLGMGIMASYFVDLYPTSCRGMVTCLSIMVGRSSTFIGINAVGNLIFNHCQITFYLWSVLVFSSVVAAWFLPPDRVKQDVKPSDV